MLVFSFLLIPFSHALLVSPAKVEFAQYSEEASEEFDVTITNDIDKDIVIEMSYESWEGKINYEEYFTAVGYENNKIAIPAGESRTVHFLMEYPFLEQFGNVRFATIRFYQVPILSDGSNIAATVAIRIPLETTVVYPEKYVKIEVEDPVITLPSADAEIHATLSNLGMSVLQKVSGNFILSKGEESFSYPFGDVLLLLQGESETVSAVIPAGSLDTGRYSVVTEVSYDGEQKVSSPANFIVGEKTVEILALKKDTFTAQSSDTITVSLLSHWVEDVDVSLGVDLLTLDGEILQSADFGSYTLPVAESKDISSGFSFQNYDVGNYQLRVRTTLDGIEVTKEFPITLIPTDALQAAPEQGSSMTFYAVLLVLLVLLLFSLLVYLYYKRKNDALG